MPSPPAVVPRPWFVLRTCGLQGRQYTRNGIITYNERIYVDLQDRKKMLALMEACYSNCWMLS